MQEFYCKVNETPGKVEYVCIPPYISPQEIANLIQEAKAEVARIFEEIEKTGVLRDHRYVIEGDMRQEEVHYPERCSRCDYEKSKSKYTGGKFK